MALHIVVIEVDIRCLAGGAGRGTTKRKLELGVLNSELPIHGSESNLQVVLAK